MRHEVFFQKRTLGLDLGCLGENLSEETYRRHGGGPNEMSRSWTAQSF